MLLVDQTLVPKGDRGRNHHEGDHDCEQTPQTADRSTPTPVRRYGVRQIDLARSPADGHPLGNGGQSVSHPGLYLMGVHCSRLVCSQFLRGMALDAPQVAASVARRLGDLGAVAGQRSI